MSGDVSVVEAYRARWRRHREEQCVINGVGERFASGGLGRHVDRLDVRIMMLSADPQAEAVPLDGGVLDWLKADRPAPYGGRSPRWGGRDRATSDALVRYEQYREDGGWDRCVALHRHGGLELGFGNLAARGEDLVVFPLRGIVGLAWALLEMQVEVAGQWSLAFPCELTVALRNTSGGNAGRVRGRMGRARHVLFKSRPARLHRGPCTAALGTRQSGA